MSFLGTIVSDSIQRLGWALLHSVWQGALVGALTTLVACGVLVASSGAATSAPTVDDPPDTINGAGMTPAEPQSKSGAEEYMWACTTVDEQTGKPIAGVRISWDFHRPHPIPDGADRSLWKDEFVSDRNGRYEVTVPKSIVDQARDWIGIEYHHPRYLPSRGSSWPRRMPEDPQGKGLDHRHAKLEPGVKVTGRVVKPDGSPAVNIPIMFLRSRDGFGDYNGGYLHGFWTRTDEDGQYLFYMRNTWPQRIHWFPDQYEANSKALTKNFGEQETIRLKPGLTLTGRVTDAQGKPLDGIVVRATTGTRVPYLFATSDAKGIFRFTPLPPGTYGLTPVRSYHDNLNGDTLSATLPYPVPSISHVLNSSTASAEPKAMIKASPLIKIPVEVVDAEGNPKSENRLSIGDLGDFINAVKAQPVEGSPGKFEFLYPRDRYIRDLKARRSMDEAAFYQLNRNHPPVAAEAIVLGKFKTDLPPIRVVIRQAATLVVKARTEDGKEPTERVSVYAKYGPETEARIAAAEQANRDPRAHFTVPRLFHTHPANQPWNPTFQHLVPGEPIVLTVQSDAYAAEPKTVTLKDGESKTVEIVLKKSEDADKQP